ncbi:MAG TPA: glycosyltransferase [Syntrophales bacterium]|nr:glycosyltransferase [Syntrophales bacterium]
MSPFPNCAEVFAVVTTFRPDNRFPGRVERILPQVGGVVIVNDGGTDDSVGKLNRWFAGKKGVRLHHNTVNAGIAASLNRGVAVARENGFRWILTLDDDSVVRSDMVERLIDGLKGIRLEKPVGIIGMSWAGSGEIGKRAPAGEDGAFLEKRGIITSGSLFSLETYDRVGPFREEFFIDSVDLDYCLRARRKGFAVVRLKEIGFVHSIGASRVVRFMGIPVLMEDQKPFRVYYGYRNGTVLALECLGKDPLYSMAFVVGQAKKFFRIALFERKKAEKLRYAARGLRDGWRRNLGRRFPGA